MSSAIRLAAFAAAGVLWSLVVAAQAVPQSCVDVKIGSDPYYSCLNKRLQGQAEPHRFTSRDAPYSAASPDPAVNTFNQAATREQLGSAFGHSAFPQRPPTPQFAPPFQQGR